MSTPADDDQPTRLFVYRRDPTSDSWSLEILEDDEAPTLPGLSLGTIDRAALLERARRLRVDRG